MSDHSHHSHGHDGHPHPDHASAHQHAAHHAATAISNTGGSDFTSHNRAHWDSMAKSYTSQPWQKDIVTRVTAFLQSNLEFLGLPTSTQVPHEPRVRVLDYACGPGTVTFALAGHADEFVGLDLSDGMVAEYNSRAQREGLDIAHATQADLLSKDEDTMAKTTASFSGPEHHDFDLAIVGLGFHHFEDLPHATKILADRLKPGGTLAIVDLMSHEMEDNPTNIKKIVAHAGFGQETVKKLFEEAGGLVDVDWTPMEGEIMIAGKNPRRVFLARGRKPGREKL
ncbi:uncharacterized protein AB675_9759 [Cyphellophora attinorum]|uniref:Methyltransferase domain-containing protein n=1 Tax=Cyphellophora attinorum TaxID=1664694 RepID=A0A0N1H787_9EURO|nr:uncharacterized protein AB675_9759 [Phialophora attinorum]KPI42277.1 hypothetical protein AB675_9759 [Phialophora attinorum]